jgi:nitrite reductase/ring-hydroxylating ferredoxin subunit|tara:strand:- start:171 stop:623 length:453 start_codon:yes stop_codon:yes gene_type:complete
MNRRDFLTTSSKVACACALGAGSLLINSCSNPNESTTPIDSTGVELDFDLTTDEFVPLQIDGGSVATGVNEIDSAGLLLLRSGDNIKAFTRRCTHQGVQLNAFSDGVSVCAYGHGAQFNSNGQHISGPGDGSLKSYDTLLDENILTVYGG